MADNRLGLAVIKVDGRELTAEAYGHLASLRVEESIHLPDAFELRFSDPNFELFDARTLDIGQRVEIALRAEGDPVIVTTGEVTAIQLEVGPTGQHEFVVNGMDAGHRLARTTRRRSFSSMSDADIADQIAAEYSLRTRIDAGGPMHDHVLQANETDLAFLRRRAARNGQSVWVVDDTLHIARPAPGERAPTLRWGGNLLEFDARFSSVEHADEVTVRGWDPVGKKAILGHASAPQPGTDAPAAGQASDRTRSSFGRTERTAVSLVVADQREADAVAAALISRATGDGAVVRGVAVGDPQIGAGAAIVLEGVGTRLAGRYTATTVVHRWFAGQPYTTRFSCGPNAPVGLADLVGAPVSDLRPVMPHLTVGEVTNTDDPLGLGRVKVRVPTLSTEDESAWARLVAPGAGKQRGLQCIPEVQDEVLVGFEHGDPARPYVLGGLWNDADPPPDPDAARSGSTQRWSFTSRKGTRLVVHDDPTEKVEFEVANSTTRLVLSDREVAITGAQKLVISAQQIEVDAKASLKLSAGADVTVSGGVIKLN